MQRSTVSTFIAYSGGHRVPRRRHRRRRQDRAGRRRSRVKRFCRAVAPERRVALFVTRRVPFAEFGIVRVIQ